MAERNNKTVVATAVKEVPQNQEFPDVLADCFARYAKMVLTDRAIPDARDGLKPVQRRIIYDMWKQGITHDKRTVKCAKTVGNVLGNYHPHGDSSVYEAMVRLSQDWKMEVPLLTFQGNNGSIDNDPPAAYRYTEAKLSLGSYFLTKDLDEETVDMMLTFDDMNTEPVVLPAGFPNLLINGAQGIAVGNATNIPAHNPTEIIQACIYRIQNPYCTLTDLRTIVKGPDFPTGGLIDEPDELTDLYATGKASFHIIAHAFIEPKKNQIIIDEIPYGVVKSQLVADLDEKRVKDGLDNITEVRDESAEDIRIVLDIRKGIDPQIVLNYLLAKGLLRTTFAANMLALDEGHPRTLGLLPLIDSYLAHAEEVVTRRSQFQLKKAQNRLEIVEGLLKAESVIDAIIKTIKAAASRAQAKEDLMQKFALSANQADAIGNMRLYALTKLDVTALKDEHHELKAEIKSLEAILNARQRLDEQIIAELTVCQQAIGKPRKTRIYEEALAVKPVDAKNLIATEPAMAVLTRDGYVKRTNLRSYQAALNNSDNAAEELPGLKTGDCLVMALQATTHDDVLAFTSQGNYIVLPIWQLQEGKWRDEGKHLSTLISLDSSEHLVSAYVITAAKPGLAVAFLTKKGKLKRVELGEFSLGKLTSRPLKCAKLAAGDEVIGAVVTSGNSDLLVVAQDGAINRFNESEVPLVGLTAVGVKAMNLPRTPVDLAFLMALTPNQEGKILVVCETRKATCLSTIQIPTGERLGAKTQLVRVPLSAYARLVGLTFLGPLHAKPAPVLLALNTGSLALDVANMGVSSLGVMLKVENIKTTPPKSLIMGVHQPGVIIDENTPVYAPAFVPSATTKAQSDKSPKQPTFFELLDEDNSDE